MAANIVLVLALMSATSERLRKSAEENFIACDASRIAIARSLELLAKTHQIAQPIFRPPNVR